MNRTLRNLPGLILITLWALFTSAAAMAIEEPAFKVLKKDGRFELREYSSYVVAEIEVEAEFTEAGNRAFRPLFRYISGENTGATKIEMTVPVTQAAAGEKIEMTVPVTQREAGATGRHVVAFVLPARFTLANAPAPRDPAVRLREVPARLVAVRDFSGAWGLGDVPQYETELAAWVKQSNLRAVGRTEMARYNAPMVPWFMRRNEMLQEVARVE